MVSIMKQGCGEIMEFQMFTFGARDWQIIDPQRVSILELRPEGRGGVGLLLVETWNPKWFPFVSFFEVKDSVGAGAWEIMAIKMVSF